MARKIDEYQLLIFLLEKIESGGSNDFSFDEEFLENLKLKYKKTTNQELENIILKCKTHKWIEKKGHSRNCPFKITERGKGVATSKRKELNENTIKKINKFIGEYKNVIYFISFCVSLIVAYIKIGK